MENLTELKKLLTEHLTSLDRSLKESEGIKDDSHQILASILRAEKRNLIRINMLADILLKQNEAKG